MLDPDMRRDPRMALSITGRYVGHRERPGQVRLRDGGMDGLSRAGWAGR